MILLGTIRDRPIPKLWSPRLQSTLIPWQSMLYYIYNT